jgi:hypothetical protein
VGQGRSEPPRPRERLADDRHLLCSRAGRRLMIERDPLAGTPRLAVLPSVSP